MSINPEKIRSPLSIFCLYVIVAGVIIYIFRYVFPASPIPLIIYSKEWRTIQGFMEVCNFFPALALSAIVLPFGLAAAQESFPSFSEMFFKRLVPSLMVAIVSALIYAVIFFFAIPTLKNKEDTLRYQGDLYNLAKERMQVHIRADEWVEASQFLEVCDLIWPNNHDFDKPRNEIEVALDRMQYAKSGEEAHAREVVTQDWRFSDLRSSDFHSTNVPTLSVAELNVLGITPDMLGGFRNSEVTEDRRPLAATQAISMGQAALRERRYFDAHWLATLGARIAPNGSPQEANARRLASEAWNMIASQSPNRREQQQFALYELKLSGYQAMADQDWIRGYYIFLEFLSKSPDDPDVKKFLDVCQKGLLEYAFFIDEIKLSIGNILSGALFSLPGRYTPTGVIANGEVSREVIRFASLTLADDYAYGTGFEFMEFNLSSHPIASLKAPYVKLLPITVDDKPQIMVITHALSRFDKDLSWESEWQIGKKVPTLIIDISFEDFLLLAQVRKGLHSLQINELFEASQKLGLAGYISQIFEAEILNRLSSVVFLLPAAIITIVIGWRYRTKTRPRYLFILMMPVLPIVFHGFVHMYRSILNTIGIWLVLSVGFSSALVLFIVCLVMILLISMIVLAGQQSKD
jgi:hypothetical protein